MKAEIYYILWFTSLHVMCNKPKMYAVVIEFNITNKLLKRKSKPGYTTPKENCPSLLQTSSSASSASTPLHIILFVPSPSPSPSVPITPKRFPHLPHNTQQTIPKRGPLLQLLLPRISPLILAQSIFIQGTIVLHRAVMAILRTMSFVAVVACE